MYIEHLRTEFYDILIQSRPLIIAAPDVDSVCAVKILQTLFALDGVSYTLVAADGYGDIKEHFQEFKDKVKNVVLINCGGTIDILGHLDNPKDVTIFLVDSHRPTHILNIYDDTQQVKIVIPPGENEEIPLFDEVFQCDEEENDESDHEDVLSELEDDERVSRQLKKKEKDIWREKRKRLLFEYSQYSYFGPPASIIMLEVAWTMNRGEHDLVWCGIVGLTDYYTLNKMDRQHYVLLANQLQTHVSRLIHARQAQRDSVKLLQEKDVSLLLYRHWTLMDSLATTPYFAVKLKFWIGENHINRFLLDVGLPQTECKQKFVAMDFQVRKNFKEMLIAKASKWNLEDITLPSFTRQMGLKRKFGALDCHLAALSTLECNNGRSLSDRFKAALDTLPSDRVEDLDKGIEAAKTVLRTIMTQVQQFIETGAVKNLGPFLLATVHDAQVGTVSFANPNTLSLLCRFALMAVVESAGGRRRSQLPLITIVESSEDVNVIMGIPPLAADNQSNLFGKAFERVSEMLPETVWMDSFEAHVVLIHPGSRKTFLDKIKQLLRPVLASKCDASHMDTGYPKMLLQGCRNHIEAINDGIKSNIQWRFSEKTPNKPGSRSLSTTKSRLNTHNHKFEAVESRKRSPENYNNLNSPQSPQAATDVMVFTSSQSHHSNRPPQGSRGSPYPEYPGVDEMYKYVQDVWDQKMTEANAPNSKIKCLNLSKPSLLDKPVRKDSTGTAPVTTPAKRQSPHQHSHPNKKY